MDHFLRRGQPHRADPPLRPAPRNRTHPARGRGQSPILSCARDHVRPRLPRRVLHQLSLLDAKEWRLRPRICLPRLLPPILPPCPRGDYGRIWGFRLRGHGILSGLPEASVRCRFCPRRAMREPFDSNSAWGAFFIVSWLTLGSSHPSLSPYISHSLSSV